MTYIQQITLFLHLAFFAMTFTFLIQQQHFLMSLFSLEGMMLTLVALLPLTMNMSNMPIATMSIIMLTFGACEASLGLSLMVLMSRYYGSDMLKSLNSIKC